MGYRIQNRRDTAERWAEVNPILLEGEVGYVTDNPNQHKIGDGIHRWNDLPLRGYTGTIAQELGNDENAVVSQKVVTEKLSELGSEVFNNTLIGRGSTFVSFKHRGFIKGNLYRLIIDDNNWDRGNIGSETQIRIFVIIAYKNGEVVDRPVNVYYGEYVDKTYTFIYEDWDYIVVGGRANEGVNIQYTFEDITDIEGIKELASNLIKVIELKGNDETAVTTIVGELYTGHEYKLTLLDKSVIVDVSENLYKFSISTISPNGELITDIIRIKGSETIEKGYTFVMPNDGTSKIRVGVRCTKNSPFRLSIEDVTYSKVLEPNVNDAIGLLNISQITPYIRIYGQDAIESVSSEFFLTPFIPIKSKDNIEVYCGFVDTQVRFASYDENKQYLGSFSQNADPRKVAFSNELVRFLRCSFNYDNIGAYVKVNGRVVFEWTKNLRDLYIKYKQIENIQEGPMYRSFIECSGISVTYPRIIRNILPKRIYRIHLLDKQPPSEGHSNVGSFKFSVRSYDKQGENFKTLLTVNYEHEWKEYYDVETPENADYLYIRARCEPKYKLPFLIEDISLGNSVSGIIKFNTDEEFKPKFQSAKKRYYTSSDTTKKNPIVIAHLSDIHANWDNVSRFIEFTSHWEEYIDLLVNTGDTVSDTYANGIEGFDEIIGSENIINVVGNHDTANYLNGAYDWDKHVGVDVYNLLVAKNVAKWNVVQPLDAELNGYCYFYKDYSDNHLRVIFVDIMGYDDVEDVWLTNVLSDALSNNYDVLVAVHFAGSTDDGEKSVFDKLSCNYSTKYEFGSDSQHLNSYNTIAYKMMQTVQNYIDNGGLFCGYIQGHYHADFVAKVAEYPKQMIYSVGSSKKGEVRDYNHIVGTRNQDEFQIVSVDTYLKIVKLYKVGANVDLYGRHKNSICINYVTGDIVAEGL